MVYFHGGAYIMGGGASFFFGPAYLLEQNVVLVTFNYTNGDADLVDHLPQVELKPGESVELTVSPRKAGHVDIVAFTSQESNVR